MIAAYVSSRNDCHFCQASHSAAAAHHLDGNYAIVDAVKRDYESAPVSSKLKALLNIAGKGAAGRQERDERRCDARAGRGRDRPEIHDAVLIAAAFCMFNRYVDGLATLTPTDHDAYDQMGRRMAKQGYVQRPTADR